MLPQQPVDYFWFLPPLLLFITWFKVQNTLVRWTKHTKDRHKVSNYIRSLVHSEPETSRAAVLANVVMYAYYNELFDTSEVHHGIRPFLIGLWCSIVGPSCLVTIPSYVVLLISNKPPFQVLGVALLIIFIVVAGVFLCLFDRFEKIQNVRAVEPENGVEKVKRFIRGLKD